jgi:predicted ribosomally synthesized peptide with nif11-like leader
VGAHDHRKELPLVRVDGRFRMLNDGIIELTRALATNESFRREFQAVNSFEEAAALARRHGCSVTAADLEALAHQSSGLEGELSEAELETISAGEAGLFGMFSSLLKSCDQIASSVVKNIRG